MPVEVFKRITEETLANEKVYYEVTYAHIPGDLRKAVGKRAMAIQKLTQEDGIAAEIVKPFRSQRATVVSSLVLQCKAHKPPGAVTFRAIHATPDYLLEGIARLVRHVACEQLRRAGARHLIKSSSEVVADLKQLAAQWDPNVEDRLQGLLLEGLSTAVSRRMLAALGRLHAWPRFTP